MPCLPGEVADEQNVLVKLHIRDTNIGDKVVDGLPAASPAVYPQKPDCELYS